MFRQLLAWIRSLFKDQRVFGATRSSQWPKVRAEHVKANPACAWCGTKDDIEVHHVRPVHKYPALELDPKNLLSLCAHDHLVIGHFGRWASYNASVVEDCALWRRRIVNRP